MHQLAWTFAALAALGGIARAGGGDDEGVAAGVTLTVDSHGSHRSISQDYLVKPSGGELSSSMRFVTAEPVLGGERLKFSDLGLFGLTGRWSVLPYLEVSGEVTLLPKQPSYTSEKAWQSVGIGLRTPIGRRVAVALAGAGGHLLSHQGMWTRESLAIQWRKPIAQVLSFGVSGGVDAITLSAPGSSGALLAELAVATTALVREPTGHWGAWLGIGYAVPIAARGIDPTTQLEINPQPRLDVRAGTVWSIDRRWDLFAEYAVIDRGDLGDPTTRLPILDGGFDQHQVILGVTRHLEAPRKQSRRNDPLQMSSR